MEIGRKKQIWFKRKLYGYGWYPSTWQGWAIIACWAALFFLGITFFAEHIIFPIFVFIITGILIIICYKYGETPRWQWRKDKDNK